MMRWGQSLPDRLASVGAFPLQRSAKPPSEASKHVADDTRPKHPPHIPGARLRGRQPPTDAEPHGHQHERNARPPALRMDKRGDILKSALTGWLRLLLPPSCLRGIAVCAGSDPSLRKCGRFWSMAD